MERAYEQIPGNQVLQDALRGLYGKRDGEGNTPAKIQLTRGALARQYVNGQLYDQALIELRNALQKDASRIDLEVMLSETLWESQHPVEAG
jgi:Tfp pilus assembly protein PilF